MRGLVVDPIDHRSRRMAQRIHAIQLSAYTQEAELLGAVDFPPLRRTCADIENSNERFFGGYLNGVLVGIIALEGVSMATEVRISSLVVAPASQRRGVGRALLSATVSEFATKVIVVSTGAGNAPALALYTQFGFAEINRHRIGPEALQVVLLSRPSSNQPAAATPARRTQCNSEGPGRRFGGRRTYYW
jgi:ribosomal protein S18 acetylase RimI-like enzyme